MSIETGGYPPVLKCQGIGHTIGHFFSLKGILGGYPPALKCIGHSFIKLSDECGHLLSYETDL